MSQEGVVDPFSQEEPSVMSAPAVPPAMETEGTSASSSRPQGVPTENAQPTTVTSDVADVGDVFGVPEHDEVTMAFGLAEAGPSSNASPVNNTAAMDDLIASEPVARPQPAAGTAGATNHSCTGKAGNPTSTQQQQQQGENQEDEGLEAIPSMAVNEEGQEEEIGYIISAVQIKPSVVFDTLLPPPKPPTPQPEAVPPSSSTEDAAAAMEKSSGENSDDAGKGEEGEDDRTTPVKQQAQLPPPPKPAAKVKAAGPLPEMMNMPLAQRCDFCIKFNSVCSNCHFKWKGFVAVKKRALGHAVAGLPEADRTAMMLTTMARGHTDFAKVLLETSSTAHGTVGPFQPLASDDVHPQLESAGLVFPLHVACAYNRVDMAKCLFDAGAKVQRSENRLVPFTLLTRPPEQNSLTDEWEAELEERDVYVQYTMVERAKQLRREERYDDALLEYDAILQQFPNSEGAHCGLPKMFYDRGDFTECLKRCDEVFANRSNIEWIEFAPTTIVELKENALTARHEKCHAEPGSSLKECGCVVTTGTVISMRRLPFVNIITTHILPFLQGHDLYQLYLATKIPLLRIQTELMAGKLCDDSIGTMLAGEFGYTEMYNDIAADKPVADGRNFGVAVKFLGVQVVAMGDFHTFILRAGARVENPRYKKKESSWFSSKKDNKEKPTLVAIKLYRVHRAGVGKAWDVQESGEWEVADPMLDV